MPEMERRVAESTNKNSNSSKLTQNDADSSNVTRMIKTLSLSNGYTPSKSSDVGVQATPAAVAKDLQNHGVSVASDKSNCMNNHSTSISGVSDENNSKEKTPMCLINELARYNKVPHKYILVDEKGPAHKKEFHIRLDLGSESYQATGSSIKRAQHAAAEVALVSTTFKRPCTRGPKSNGTTASATKKVVPVTPTVELNALVMRLGVQAEYHNVELHRFSSPYPQFLYAPNLADPFHQIPYSYYAHAYRGHPPIKPFCSVILRVGKHEFKGEGVTRQQARHNAASKALAFLKNTTLQQDISQSSSNGEEQTNSSNSNVDNVASSPTTEDPDDTTTTPVCMDEENANKSEISLVHEIALHINKTVSFEVIHESGPPHMRNFITRCQCGDFITEGEGNSKKSSKKKAADLMLAKLNMEETPVATSKQKVKNIANKKKNRNLIKMQKANVEYGSGINPISRLIQIQQANKKKEPIYVFVREEGLPRRREFIIQVECNDKVCQGRGPNKKLAKRNAAEKMLELMGYSKPSPSPGKSVLKSPDSGSSNLSSSNHSKHVTFSDTAQPNSKLPGVIVKQEHKKNSNSQVQVDMVLLASSAKELLDTGKSKTCEAVTSSTDHSKEPFERYKDRLEYLCKCFKIKLDYTDFPKGSNTKQCLTLVAVHTNPAQVFHGNAPSIDESHDKASYQALQKLAQSPSHSKNSDADVKDEGHSLGKSSEENEQRDNTGRESSAFTNNDNSTL